MTTTQKTTLPNGEELFLGDTIVFDPHNSCWAGHWIVEEIAGDGYVTVRGTVAKSSTPTEPVSKIIRIAKKNMKAREKKVTEDMLLDAPTKSALISEGLDDAFVKKANGLWSNGRFDLSPEMLLFFRGDTKLTLNIPEPELISVDKDQLQAKRDAVHAELGRINQMYVEEYTSPDRDIEKCKRLWVEFRCLLSHQDTLDAILKGDYK